MAHTFECVACGDIDVSLVHYDTNRTDAICTLCGNVTTECPWMSSSSSESNEHINSEVPHIIRKVVNDIGLEPEETWCRRLMTEHSGVKVFTARRVCSALASQFEADGRTLTPLLDYANSVHGIAYDKIIDGSAETCCGSDVYLPLIARLSERVSMGPSTRRSLHKHVLEVVRRVPELEFKLPNSVVVAVWWKQVGSQGEHLSSVCDWMHIKLPTIKRIMPLI